MLFSRRSALYKPFKPRTIAYSEGFDGHFVHVEFALVFLLEKEQSMPAAHQVNVFDKPHEDLCREWTAL